MCISDTTTVTMGSYEKLQYFEDGRTAQQLSSSARSMKQATNALTKDDIRTLINTCCTSATLQNIP
jgi:hypothetical protein